MLGFLRASTLRWSWLGCWAGAFVLTHIPITPRTSGRIPHLDKFVHAAMYFVICYLGGLTLRALGKATRPALLIWGCVYLGYAALDELTQPWTGREADMLDWVFDALGVALATLALWIGIVPRQAGGTHSD